MIILKSSLFSVVTKAIGKNLKEEIQQFVESKELNLWGTKKGNEYTKIHVNLCLYKDMNNIGYYSLWKQIKDWYGNSHKSLCHNIKLVRVALKQWAKSVVTIGNLRIWKDVSAQVSKIAVLKKVNLWMDSSDFALKGKSITLTKDKYWSYKAKSLGRRYQCIFDAEGRCRAIWGGYSPKVIDSQWVEIYKDELSTKFQGAHIIADCHYYASRNKVPGVKFVTPIPDNVKKVPEDVKSYLGILDKDKEMNKKIRNLRARVEAPFAQIQNRFKALGGTFKDDDTQLDCLVYYALAIHNKIVDKTK